MDGVEYPLEAHFVHQLADDPDAGSVVGTLHRLAVVATEGAVEATQFIHVGGLRDVRTSRRRRGVRRRLDSVATEDAREDIKTRAAPTSSAAAYYRSRRGSARPSRARPIYKRFWSPA